MLALPDNPAIVRAAMLQRAAEAIAEKLRPFVQAIADITAAARTVVDRLVAMFRDLLPWFAKMHRAEAHHRRRAGTPRRRNRPGRRRR